MIYRELEPDEIPFLEEMLYEALFVPEGAAPFPLDIIKKPEVSKYVDNWRIYPGDLAIVAVNNDSLIGAVWGRNFQAPHVGYGYIDDNTPEISMAVKPAFRNQGIGTKLLEKLIRTYQERNYRALSLSVDKLNQAKNLYLRSGFEVYKEDGTALVMRKKLE
ncbi:GNAT family N-acetyltransferase [Fulvivirgaceae bacterium BMA10]|uniref:GNAT family N-acetyltransferase n=1 Tax=Splendidivirga corallicola TaxID=3051826 RepID=A0ABT8KJN3_9BACT|nr:GNAT family N-acetyltransferase [Fulvivirgaceae bacterium BMA10]